MLDYVFHKSDLSYASIEEDSESEVTSTHTLPKNLHTTEELQKYDQIKNMGQGKPGNSEKERQFFFVRESQFYENSKNLERF